MKVKRMLVIISLPLIPELTTGFSRQKYLGSKACLKKGCMKSMSGCFSDLGGWLAMHLKPCSNVSAEVPCNIQNSWSLGREEQRISQAALDLNAQTEGPYMN